VLANISVSRYGGGWIVTQFEACNSLLAKGKEG
jgi:hypothetical protein